MSPALLQTFIGGPNRNANPHKLFTERKREAEALRDALHSTKKVEEELAVALDADLPAIRDGAADLLKVKEHIAAMKRSREKLDKEATAVIASPRVAAALADPLALSTVAEDIPHALGEQLLKICAAYLPTKAYTEMSISCSQQGTGEQVVGPAAALLARRVKAVEVQRDQALGDKDKVINRLQTGLESAMAEAKASAARLSQREAALIKQEAATAELRVSEQQALDGLDRMAAKLSETEGKVTSLEKVVHDQINQRDELSMENRELVDVNTKLAEENQEAQSTRAAAEAKVGNLQSLLEGAECNLSGEKNRVALLEAEVKSLTDTLTARAKDMTSVRMSVRDRDQTVNQLTLQLQEANDDNAAL
jgi:hypothetical protein